MASNFYTKLDKYASVYQPKEHAETFAKHASEYTHVPPTVMEAAYNIYKELPTKNASWILEAYDATDSPQAKLAFEIIGSVLVNEKNAGLVDGAISVLPKIKSVVTDAAAQTGIAGGLAAYNTNRPKNTLEQGESINKENEG